MEAVVKAVVDTRRAVGRTPSRFDAIGYPACPFSIKRNEEVSMYEPLFTESVRIITRGCTQAGAYERLYADIQPRRQGWARRGRCGDPSRRGGVIL